MAQLVEHILGKDEVPSSNLGSSSKKKNTLAIAGVFLFSAPLPINSHRVFALCAKSSSVTPPEDRGACTPGVGRVNLRRAANTLSSRYLLWECTFFEKAFPNPLTFGCVGVIIYSKSKERSINHATYKRKKLL